MINMALVVALIKKLAPAADPATIESAVTDWLDDHPEATTTVQDGSITRAKLDALLQQELDNTVTKENIHNLIGIIEGLDFLDATITENKYANYSSKAIANLQGLSVAEFDVTHVVKFEYRYKINQPDSRGLYFVDKNGTALSTSYQTLATDQDIEVPAGAVKCYATITNFENDIYVYEIIAENPEELLKAQASYTNKTSGGVEYTWQNSNTKVWIHGKRTSTSFDEMSGSPSALPQGIIPGKKYNFIFNPTDKNIKLELLIYENGTNTVNKRITDPTIWTIPATTTGLVIRLGVLGTNAVVDEVVNCPEVLTIPETKSVIEQLSDLNKMAYGDDSNPLAYVHTDPGLISIFHKVGCIGDSLASGACAYKENGETHYIDLYPFSWGQCLARLTGNTYYNFSAGGLSSRSWLASQHATDCFDGQHNCDAYFIGLGQNDKNKSIPVGTTEDIDLADYTQNEDTYCGNIGQIIQRLQILQPKAPIFVFIDPAPPSGDQSYNEKIPEIVALFENVWIIDLNTYGKDLFTVYSEIIGSQSRSGHFSALGYQQIAYAISTYVDWIIKHNLGAFSQVEFIGTNYEWPTA